MQINLSLPNLNLSALNALAPNAGGMLSSPVAPKPSMAPIVSVAPVVAPKPFVAPVATQVAPMVSTAPVVAPIAPVAPIASVAPVAPPPPPPPPAPTPAPTVDLGAIQNALASMQNTGGMFNIPSITPIAQTPVAPVSLAGATDIFGGRTYEAPLATPGKTRVGYMEMKKLSETPGFITTNRPEQIGDMYLPFRPSGEGDQVTKDIETWYKYYSDNPDFRKFLSADEQTELTWLDYRNKKFDQKTFTQKINDIRAQFNLPQKVGFKDFEAHFSYGVKQKRQSSNPYADLLKYGPSIGGYWNPENDPSDFQKAMANPLVGAVTTTLGATLGGPIGAAIAGGATSKLSGADWSDALKAAAISGGSAYLAGQMAGPKVAPTSEFNIPALNANAPSVPLGGINTDLIRESLFAPTAASAIANPAFELAAPSFFQTAVGQGLGKAGLTLAAGGDPKDALTAGLLGYTGAPGGALSGTLGSAGANFGTSTVGNALNNLSIADALKFGIKLPKEQWSAVGGLFGDLDLGAISDYGAFNALPKSLQTALSNVKLSDVLENIGGPDYGSLLNIAYDVKLPGVESGLFSGLGLNIPNMPEWLKGIYGSAQDIFQGLPDVNFPNMNLNVPDFNIPDINIPDFNIPNIQAPNIAVPNVSLPSVTTPEFNIPNINTPNIELPSLPETAAQKATSGFGNLFGGGGSGTNAEPFMAQVAYNPGLPQLTPIAYSDPLSVLLAEFYKL